MVEKTAKRGDNVSIEYTGKLETGETFDTSQGRGPLEFELGSGKVIKGFEEGIIGMKIGEEKEITIIPEDGYGHRNDAYIKDIPRDQVPKELELKKGLILMFKRPDGMSIPATIAEIEEKNIKVDFNHPLAGKTLKFTVKLVAIK